MSDPNPYEAPQGAPTDWLAPQGRIRSWHIALWVCLLFAIPFYVLMALVSAFEFRMYSDAKERLAYAMWFVAAIGSAFICRYAFKRVAKAQPASVLFALLGLSLLAVCYFGGFTDSVFHKLAGLIVCQQ